MRKGGYCDNGRLPPSAWNVPELGGKRATKEIVCAVCVLDFGPCHRNETPENEPVPLLKKLSLAEQIHAIQTDKKLRKKEQIRRAVEARLQNRRRRGRLKQYGME